MQLHHFEFKGTSVADNSQALCFEGSKDGTFFLRKNDLTLYFFPFLRHIVTSCSRPVF